MAYFFNTPEDIKAMLAAIGESSIDNLFRQIPADIRRKEPLAIPPAMGELELSMHMRELSERNLHASNSVCFLGGGTYDHFIPAAVDALASRGEFFTSYTPYQPEVSQGNLQVMFEYQTLICQLTGMDVSNASLYDGGSALAEAALMCLSTTKRYGNVVVSESVHPEYRQILATYLHSLDTVIRTVPCRDGVTDIEALGQMVDAETACVMIQQPNFFGRLEPVERIGRIAHGEEGGTVSTAADGRGARLVVSCDPISLGILRRPGDLGADIVVAEGQSLGSPMAYGGPFLGILACREEFLRRLPGRLAGQTVDRRGRRCWVLTLQTREQHIRREKATSNICTNQGLFALRAAIYLSLLGPQGLRDVASLCVRKARYAADAITACDRFELAMPGPIFKEFVVRDRDQDVPQVLRHAQAENILAGVPLDRWYPDHSDCFLVAVTEQRTRSQIDQLARALAATPRHSGTPA